MEHAFKNGVITWVIAMENIMKIMKTMKIAMGMHLDICTGMGGKIVIATN